MPQSPDYKRRRIVVAAIGALLLVAGNDRPMIGTISITMDERRLPQVGAEWSPPLAFATAALAQAMALIQALAAR